MDKIKGKLLWSNKEQLEMTREEKKKAIEDKLNEVWGCLPITVEQCKTCVYSRGPAPFENAPEKKYCLVYRRKDILGKPDDIYHEGAECLSHTTAEEAKEIEERLKKRMKKENKTKGEQRQDRKNGST